MTALGYVRNVFDVLRFKKTGITAFAKTETYVPIVTFLLACACMAFSSAFPLDFLSPTFLPLFILLFIISVVALAFVGIAVFAFSRLLGGSASLKEFAPVYGLISLPLISIISISILLNVFFPGSIMSFVSIAILIYIVSLSVFMIREVHSLRTVSAFFAWIIPNGCIFAFSIIILLTAK